MADQLHLLLYESHKRHVLLQVYINGDKNILKLDKIKHLMMELRVFKMIFELSVRYLSVIDIFLRFEYFRQ